MNQESLGNTEDNQVTKDIAAIRAARKKKVVVAPTVEPCSDSCEVQWKPVKANRA